MRMSNYQQMQAEDEQAHEDGMAIAAGTMCSFCLSVMHVAPTWDDCPREQQYQRLCAGCQESGFEEFDADNLCRRCSIQNQLNRDAFYAEQEGKPDFTCSNCSREFFLPHEGYFLDIHDETVGRCVDCHIKNFKPCTDVLCCA